MLSCTCGLDAAIAAHVEAQKSSKVLTDEACRDIAKNYGMKHGPDRGPNPDVFDALRYARDNGYLAPAQPTLSVDKIMEVYHEHERWFNLHGGAPAKRSGNFKARINKLLKTNERE